LSPQWHSPIRAPTPSGKGVFHAQAFKLRQVAWPDKFKPGSINKYDDFSIPEEFIQVYHMVIEAARGDDQVKANYLPMTLYSVARSWLVNLLEGTIYNWDQLCAMFIENFHVTYEHSSTVETLKTIQKKHDESLWDYVKCFYNTRDTIPNIQDIEIMNAVRDEVSDIKIVEEITTKKPKAVVDLLADAAICIKASDV
jgi:hypothetical protein